MGSSKHTPAAIDLLKQLIQIPSLSRQEDKTADCIVNFFHSQAVTSMRQGNNVWVLNQAFSAGKPTILLNSHHDTVKAKQDWTRDPHAATVEGDTLYGLGSNDAGGPLVSLMACFLHFYERKDLPYNLIMAATAEEEISGANGIASILPQLGTIDLGIVGEPTEMQLAIAEKGLMVMDCYGKGKSGHAARNEGINAIYASIPDINWFQNYQFEEVSDFLGPVKMSVTQINAGTQHNVVPDECHFVVDVRTNEFYSNQKAFEIIDKHTQCELKPRSFRLNSSRLAPDHPIVRRGRELGRETYGSPTLSDQALMPFPTLKMGPGDSARSHTADEYILLSEIELGVELYIQMLDGLVLE
ncbi:MAG: M20 family metallo-hydrolase [Bacteroidota bacterium]